MTPEEIKYLVIGILIGIVAGQLLLVMMAALFTANKEK